MIQKLKCRWWRLKDDARHHPFVRLVAMRCYELKAACLPRNCGGSVNASLKACALASTVEDMRRCAAPIQRLLATQSGRAACVRALRSAFGPMFTGGFSHTEFARKYYPDALASNSAMTSKRRYLALLREHPICVATTGLHQSIGWKMGEYVALSKAVIAEKLHFEVPGPFADGINYLGFTTPEECVDKVQELVGSPDRRASLMQANRSYFETWLRPAALVWNSLAKAKGMKSAGELTE